MRFIVLAGCLYLYGCANGDININLADIGSVRFVHYHATAPYLGVVKIINGEMVVGKLEDNSLVWEEL